MAISPITSARAASACLIVGVDNHVGAYLARLLDARGVALAGVGDAGLLSRLGIAGQVIPVAASDVASAASDSRLVFAISDGSAERADLLATAIAATDNRARLIHVADVADLAQAGVRDIIGRIAAAREASDGEAANVLLEAHDSRFGTRDTLMSRIIALAYAAANGDARGVQDIVEPGPRDWGWTPEYVDAVQRLATRERLIDLVVASGNAITAAEITHAAFGFFRVDPASHVKIVGTGTLAESIDPATVKAAIGWTAYTRGPDLIRAFCEGAADRV